MMPFSIPTRSLLGMVAATVAIMLARQFGGLERHTLGHPGLVDALVLALLWLLFVTHLMIAVLMWLQRGQWLPSDAAMFRFIAAKALLWITTVTAYRSAGFGVRLDVATLYLVIALTTIDLDIRMCRRYLFQTADEREEARGQEWDGSERRGPEPGRRATDARP